MNLRELIYHIHRSPAVIPFVALTPADWDQMRDEIAEDEFCCNPNLNAVHFLVCGIPVIKGGHA